MEHRVVVADKASCRSVVEEVYSGVDRERAIMGWRRQKSLGEFGGECDGVSQSANREREKQRLIFSTLSSARRRRRRQGDSRQIKGQESAQQVQAFAPQILVGVRGWADPLGAGRSGDAGRFWPWKMLKPRELGGNGSLANSTI